MVTSREVCCQDCFRWVAGWMGASVCRHPGDPIFAPQTPTAFADCRSLRGRSHAGACDNCSEQQTDWLHTLELHGEDVCWHESCLPACSAESQQQEAESR